VPPDDLSSSYTYERCLIIYYFGDGSTRCLLTAPALMDVLKITPPFFYSYQCGSTLLTSYIPVHLYSITLQILLTIVSFVIIFSSSNKVQSSPWLLSVFPGVCWPSYWQTVGSSAVYLKKKPVLIKFSQIISRAMNNIILLLSFGLCSPVLCALITVSICLHLWSWLVLIGRFVFARIEALGAGATSSLLIDGGWPLPPPPPLLSSDSL
jgi:hypothetical protein